LPALGIIPLPFPHDLLAFGWKFIFCFQILPTIFLYSRAHLPLNVGYSSQTLI
jgi:hypothetical protein